MNTSHVNELLACHQRDCDNASFDALFTAMAPLIRSIARQYLRDPNDLDDVVQQVMLKINRHAGAIYGRFTSWVARATRTTCIDLIRHRQRTRDAQQKLMWQQASEYAGVLTWEAALMRLDEAMRDVDPQTRQLIVDRFIRGQRMRELADQRRTSIATISRRVRDGLSELRLALEQIGVDGLEENELRDVLRSEQAWRRLMKDGPLHQFTHRPLPSDPTAASPPAIAGEGWARPIRVGVLVSYAASTMPNLSGWLMPVEVQVDWTYVMLDPRFELVGLVEPGTLDRPMIERTLRDFDLTAGLIETTDTDGLATLDVICLGRQYNLSADTIVWLHDAVRGGVGLFNLGNTGTNCREPRRRVLEAELALQLASEFVGCYSPGYGDGNGRHHEPRRACVVASHPVLPGLTPGDAMMLDSTVRLFTPMPGAKPLVEYEQPFIRNGHCDGCLFLESMPKAPIKLAAMLAGQLGQGRVVTINPANARPLLEHPHRTTDTILAAIEWLAHQPAQISPSAGNRQHKA